MALLIATWPRRGVQTSFTAFIGPSALGALNQPVPLISFRDFERNFGDLTPEGEVAYSVRQFFMNGGREAWMVRIQDNPSEKHWRDGIRAHFQAHSALFDLIRAKSDSDNQTANTQQDHADRSRRESNPHLSSPLRI